MRQHRILEFVDGNGDVHFKCQWKGIFWHYYKRSNLHFSSPEEFENVFDIFQRIKKERKHQKKFIRSYKFIEERYGKSCGINAMKRINEGIEKPKPI